VRGGRKGEQSQSKIAKENYKRGPGKHFLTEQVAYLPYAQRVCLPADARSGFAVWSELADVSLCFQKMFTSLWMLRQEYQHNEKLPLAFNGTWPSWNSDLDNRPW
jgi:hypothetical protein